MKHELLFLGKIKDSFIEQGVKEYASRIKHYTSFEIKILREKSKKQKKISLVENQGKLLLQAVPTNAIKVVLDSRGQQFTSESFAKKIERWELKGVRHACYLIGGPDGHSQEVLRSSDLTLSISKMTFTHDMIRLLLTEQIYRAYTIKAGEKYHK